MPVVVDSVHFAVSHYYRAGPLTAHLFCGYKPETSIHRFHTQRFFFSAERIRTMKRLNNPCLEVLLLCGLLASLMMAPSCAKRRQATGVSPPGIEKNMATSLHATARGMQWWYEQSDGLGAVIDLPYADTGCGHCHTNGCSDCHSDEKGAGAVDQPQVCLGCHGRQGTEAKLGISDVHFNSGKVCSDCHSSEDIHGDGTIYDSMLEDGAIDADCEDCHGTVPRVREHTVHGNKLHCDACHIKTVTTCYNCHMNTLLEEHKKKAYRPFTGFVLLMNDAKGQVRAGTYQSVIKDQHTFVAFGPYHGHSVMAKGRTCDDCHNSDRIEELNRTGKIVMTRWDNTLANPGIVHTTGVVPFVPGNLEFQFVDYDKASNTWSPVTKKAEKSQWEFCSPLTRNQLERLARTK